MFTDNNDNVFKDFNYPIKYKYLNTHNDNDSTKCSDNCSDCCSDSDSYIGNHTLSIDTNTDEFTNTTYSIDIDVLDELTCNNEYIYENLKYENLEDENLKYENLKNEDNYTSTYCSVCCNYKNLNIKYHGICNNCWIKNIIDAAVNSNVYEYNYVNNVLKV